MFLRYVKVMLCCILCCLVPTMCNGMHIKLEGLNTELNFNIHKKLSGINTNVKLIDEKLIKQLDNVIKDSLRISGYYSPYIDFFFTQASRMIGNLIY